MTFQLLSPIEWSCVRCAGGAGAEAGALLGCVGEAGGAGDCPLSGGVSGAEDCPLHCVAGGASAGSNV